jgi:hypothetical protein
MSIRCAPAYSLILKISMRLAPVGLLLFIGLPAYGQNSLRPASGSPPTPDADKDAAVILELGPATSWNIRGGAATFAPNLAAEVTPIEDWLEIEAGVSPFYTRKSTEWDTDLLFKKPWTLSRKAEFMLGIGPQWTYLKQNGKTSNSIAAEGFLNRPMTIALPEDTSNPSE